MALSFPEVLLELARDDPRICGVSCDCWSFLEPLHAEFPQRAIEVGIAEQNLIGVGAGLAVRGNIPFVLGMNPFVTMRCFEQIRTDLGYGCRNVKVVGAYGSGVTFGGWGCTHHAIEEIGLMRLIPTMTVVMPADAYEAEWAVRAAGAVSWDLADASLGAVAAIRADTASAVAAIRLRLKPDATRRPLAPRPTSGATSGLIRADRIIRTQD